MAPLLPKLRGQFAEFLNESSHKRLRILTPPTCVGLRYGHVACIAEREFSWQLGSATFFGFNPYFCTYLYPDAARIYQSGGLYGECNGISISRLAYPTASSHSTR